MLLLVDLDGVVYRASAPVPGVAAVLSARVAAGDAVVYVTNNAMHHHSEYVPRLMGMGAPAEADRVVTSARATALHLRAHEGHRVRRVLTVGAGGLERELREAGFDVVSVGHAATRMHQEGIDGWAAAGHPDAVVVGLDPQMTYLRVAAAADCVRAGAMFVATNRDPVYPIEQGYRPGAGAVVSAIEAAGRRAPELVIGKPERHLLEAAARIVGTDVRDAVMIGDALYSDIAAARTVGCRSILMLTGVTSREQAEALPPAERPTVVAEHAAALEAALVELARG